MTSNNEGAFTVEELEQQHTAQLPDRDLMIGLTVLGIPLVGVDGLSLSVSATV
jgi:hypothetical protein